jgi:hypothetical protein
MCRAIEAQRLIADGLDGARRIAASSFNFDPGRKRTILRAGCANKLV